MPPNKGQGTAQALEDVFALARVMEQGLALSRYEGLRMPRVQKLRDDLEREATDRYARGQFGAWLRDWGFWLGWMKTRMLGQNPISELFDYEMFQCSTL